MTLEINVYRIIHSKNSPARYQLVNQEPIIVKNNSQPYDQNNLPGYLTPIFKSIHESPDETLLLLKNYANLCRHGLRTTLSSRFPVKVSPDCEFEFDSGMFKVRVHKLSTSLSPNLKS